MKYNFKDYNFHVLLLFAHVRIYVNITNNCDMQKKIMFDSIFGNSSVKKRCTYTTSRGDPDDVIMFIGPERW